MVNWAGNIPKTISILPKREKGGIGIFAHSRTDAIPIRYAYSEGFANR